MIRRVLTQFYGHFETCNECDQKFSQMVHFGNLTLCRLHALKRGVVDEEGRPQDDKIPPNYAERLRGIRKTRRVRRIAKARGRQRGDS